MNKIVVGILCGRGDTPEAVETIAAIRNAGHVGPITPLFGVTPTNKIRGGAYISMPDASQNKRGRARTELVRRVAKMFNKADLYVFLDDDTRPQPGYFRHLEELSWTAPPLLMGGKLENADGQRSWDVCAFQDKNPVIVPYSFWDHPIWYKDLYLSGPQHIFNRSGVELAAKLGYPDLEYGEDTNFCFNFKANHGQIVFIPEITARLAHQHKPPNEAMWSVSV
jgi:hypothetical protein